MKIILTETQIKNLSKLLLEYIVYPFIDETDTDYQDINYTFSVDDLTYNVNLLNRSHPSEPYDITFYVKKHTTYTYETKKDLKHLNNVLHTIDNIVRDAAKKYKIHKIQFSGSISERDDNLSTVRNDSYIRYIRQNYPNALIRKGFNKTTIELKTMFPELFSEDNLIKNKLFDVLTKINEGFKEDDWENAFTVIRDNKIIGATDSIYNDKFSDISIEIEFDYDNLYYLKLEFDNKRIREYFKNLNDLLKFLENKFEL